MRAISHEFGYGIGDDMDFLLIEVHAALKLMVRESLIAFDRRTIRVAQTRRKHTIDVVNDVRNSKAGMGEPAQYHGRVRRGSLIRQLVDSVR